MMTGKKILAFALLAVLVLSLPVGFTFAKGSNESGNSAKNFLSSGKECPLEKVWGKFSGGPGTPEPTAENKCPALEIFLENLATETGLSEEELENNMIQAGGKTLDELVDQGKITKEQKEKILECIQRMREENWDYSESITENKNSAPQIFIQNLASELNVSVDDLKSALAQAGEETLNELVKQGKITEEQKEKALECIQRM